MPLREFGPLDLPFAQLSKGSGRELDSRWVKLLVGLTC